MVGTVACLILVVAGCASAGPDRPIAAAAPDATTSTSDVPPNETSSSDIPPREVIVVPLSLHVAVEKGAPGSDLSSARTVEDLASIAAAMGEIWDQADIRFEPITVQTLEIPTDVLQGILVGNTDAFFDQVNATFIPENQQAINGFYVPEAFGVNGFTPQGSNLFFVVDAPSVRDERVSSHEVGHIFGLRHDLDNPGQLMFSGTNGTGLSELEQTVARYSILGLFPQAATP